MTKLLDYENPLMQVLNQIGRLILLNFLTVLCSLPVITAGAALTALDSQILRLVRHEESGITEAYFQAFRKNFRQGTSIWLILLACYGLVAVDFCLITKLEIPAIRPLLAAVLAALTGTALYAFPIAARFANPVCTVMRNALLMSLVQLPKTAVMMVLYAIPVGFVWLSEGLLPLWLMFGLSAPAWLSAMLYNKLFLKLEQAAKAGR